MLLIHLLTLIGVYTVLKFLFINLKSIVLVITAKFLELIRPKSKKTLKQKYGDWAVITGATDGIGKEYAKQLAKQKINIVLISRTKEKLIAVANEIETEYKVSVKWITADFSGKRHIYEHIRKELKDIPVGILVNNVGFVNDFPQKFMEQNDDFLWQMIKINICAATFMTKICLQSMIERKKGAIVNVSSIVQDYSVPYHTLYVSTKAYIKLFTKCLQYEIKPYKNITIQLLTPGCVKTKLTTYIDQSKYKKYYVIEDVENYVRQAIYTLGKTDNTTGCIKHGINLSFCNMLPKSLVTYFGYLLNKLIIEERMKRTVSA